MSIINPYRFATAAGGGGGAAPPAVSCYIVGGGGGTGARSSGGGGGGAVYYLAITGYTWAPADDTTYTVEVGSGGAGGWYVNGQFADNGEASGITDGSSYETTTSSVLKSLGGGGTLSNPAPRPSSQAGTDGGCGGGASNIRGASGQGWNDGGSGQSDIALGGTGYSGGRGHWHYGGSNYSNGGGGGASEDGSDGAETGQTAGEGGNGRANPIHVSGLTGSNEKCGGGGGGGCGHTNTTSGRAGGDGGGADGTDYYGTADGAENQGGGGGGTGIGQSTAAQGSNGGSGVVMIRYPDSYDEITVSSGTAYLDTSDGYHTYSFTGLAEFSWET